MIYELQGSDFWLDEAVDNLLDYLKKQQMDTGTIVCAAGMTPSAPIHFGILREIAISSFIADELMHRRKNVRLVYYWDDYDHFCKIPYYTTKEAVAEHIGKTLREVPDFNGSYHSYGEHYMHEYEKCLHKCGFFPDYNYQSRLYKSGYYTERIRLALNKRKEIFDIVSRSAGTKAEDMERKREAYYPLEIYCESCGKDSTVTNSWNAETDTVTYTCKNCKHEGSYIVGKNFRGKLAWKVNWALRWTDDKVCYESSGENQLTDTGSYSVSSKVATDIFGGKVPFSLLYRFVGIPGVSKVSRAQGIMSLATRFTDVLEPAIVRWLLVKNPPNKPFSVDIESGIFRIYHEWDLFCDKVESGDCTPLEKRIYDIAHDGVECSKIRIPFKTITTALGISGGHRSKAVEQMLRLTNYAGNAEELFIASCPRINAAANWLYRYKHSEEEPALRSDFNKDVWDMLDEPTKHAVVELCNYFDDFTTEEATRQILYSLHEKLGIPADMQDAARKSLFRALYLLLLGKERGPKLATLLCLTSKEKLMTLLQGE